jgi:hypothetical protein
MIISTLIETLKWWQLWRPSTSEFDSARAALLENASDPPPSDQGWKRKVVFVTGRSDFSTSVLDPDQLGLMLQLQKSLGLDDNELVYQAFPFDAAVAAHFQGVSLWEKLSAGKLRVPVISMRNFWQWVLLLTSKRYAKDIAAVLSNTLGTAHGKQSTLLFVTGSLGTAMVLSAVRHLSVRCRISILSYGGVFGDVDGLDRIESMLDLSAKGDSWSAIGSFWTSVFHSDSGAIKRATADGRLRQMCVLGPGHMAYLEDPTTVSMLLDEARQLPGWSKELVLD